MSTFIAYLCNDPSLSHIFWRSSGIPKFEGNGPGSIAWFQGGKTLRRTIAQIGGTDPELLAMMADLPHARSVLAAIDRDSTSSDAVAPFRFREWLFAHDGELPHLTETRERLTRMVPELSLIHI